jgi:hypothetical protein
LLVSPDTTPAGDYPAPPMGRTVCAVVVAMAPVACGGGDGESSPTTTTTVDASVDDQLDEIERDENEARLGCRVLNEQLVPSPDDPLHMTCPP